jgi:ADP-heptose:LPS heptosyltransferase
VVHQNGERIMMKEFQTILNKIKLNTQRINYDNARQVLVLYEEKITLIGDCCIRFDKFKYFKSFLKNATVDINFSIKDNFKFYDAFLKNNPNVDGIFTLSWKDIDFERYDIVFCIKYDERAFLEFLHEKYYNLVREDQFRLAVFSMSQLILKPQKDTYQIFPVNQPLLDYIKGPQLGELYIDEEEQTWANQWLESKGLQANEDLFILCDSTSNREKLLNIIVYFDVLKFLLRKENIKVLIFDEKDIGKEDFYQAWLQNDTKKLIFSKRLMLREDLSIMASKHTKLIFGPCTGLMHCASSIYNNYVNRGMSVKDVPVMITYTGQYTQENETANTWWGNSPLITCLLLKERNHKKQIVLLNNLTEEQRNTPDSLPCSEYTAEMLIELINSKFLERRITNSA